MARLSHLREAFRSAHHPVLAPILGGEVLALSWEIGESSEHRRLFFMWLVFKDAAMKIANFLLQASNDRICHNCQKSSEIGPNLFYHISTLQAAPIGLHSPNVLTARPVAAFEAPLCYLPPSRTSRYRRRHTSAHRAPSSHDAWCRFYLSTLWT